MSNYTFTTGARVRDTGKNITGTVADDPAMVLAWPGMIPVHWDNGDRSVASPSILAPAAGLDAFTDTELEAELQSRRDATHKAALEAAMEHLRNHPELTTPEVTVADIASIAEAANISTLAMFEAWGVNTGTAK